MSRNSWQIGLIERSENSLANSSVIFVLIHLI